MYSDVKLDQVTLLHLHKKDKNIFKLIQKASLMIICIARPKIAIFRPVKNFSILFLYKILVSISMSMVNPGNYITKYILLHTLNHKILS